MQTQYANIRHNRPLPQEINEPRNEALAESVLDDAIDPVRVVRDDPNLVQAAARRLPAEHDSVARPTEELAVGVQGKRAYDVIVVRRQLLAQVVVLLLHRSERVRGRERRECACDCSSKETLNSN